MEEMITRAGAMSPEIHREIFGAVNTNVPTEQREVASIQFSAPASTMALATKKVVEKTPIIKTSSSSETNKYFMHVVMPLTKAEIDYLYTKGIKVNIESWIPPTGNFKTGFYLVEIPTASEPNASEWLATRDFVKKVSRNRSIELPVQPTPIIGTINPTPMVALGSVPIEEVALKMDKPQKEIPEPKEVEPKENEPKELKEFESGISAKLERAYAMKQIQENDPETLKRLKLSSHAKNFLATGSVTQPPSKRVWAVDKKLYEKMGQIT